MKHIKRPCDECPWRKDCEPGRFEPERWAVLAESSLDIRTNFGPEFGAILFACHKSPEGGERACAGWLAVEGVAHPTVRLSVAMGALPESALRPGDDWPALHESFADTAAHDMGTERR